MVGENGTVVPRLSKRFNERMKSIEPSQEQPRDVPGNPYHGKEKYPIAQRGVVLPLVRDDPGKGSCYPQSDVTTGNADWFTGPCMEQHTSYSSSRLSPASVTSAADAETAISFQLALCPVEHDDHLEHGIASMGLLYSKQILAGDGFDVGEPHSQSLIPSTGANTRNARERIRKARISEGIKVLKSSVPCSGTSNKDDEGTVLDNAIDYIKYLKLQLKLLSESRLSGESATYPFVNLEGYGHYFHQQRVHNDPLEDAMGSLLEMNPQVASELLESKGLTIMPMDVAYTLLQTN